MASKHDLENLLNGQLADLLSDAGIPSQAEVKQGNRRLDVLADVDGLRVVLEAETGFDKQAQAIKDADARLKQGLTLMVFAVCYPDGARVSSLQDAELRWTLRTEFGADWSEADWSSGGIADLAAAVKQAPAHFDDVDGAARMLSQGLDAGAQRLSRSQRQVIAQTMNLPLVKGKKDTDDGYLTAAKRGLLVIATAMLFHHRLHEHLPTDTPANWTGDWPPLSAQQCALNSTDTVAKFDAAWQAVLSVDYAPVFDAAREALAALPTSADSGQLVQTLAKVVEHVARLVSGMRHDLLGRIFHRVLDTARYDGSFYTSTAAATLLAALAIREEDCDWSDVNAVAQLKICDPACGTGTLLMAAARRIHDLRQRQGLGDEDSEALLAEALVEDVLWGYDINITAIHLAASALGMLSPNTQFRHMNLHIPRFGVEDGQAYIGSLELLDGQMVLDPTRSPFQKIDDEERQQVAEHPRDMDLVIMNPPFTRDSLRYDQFDRDEERAIKQRELRVVAQHELRDAIDLSGGSPIFCVLAEHLAKDDSSSFAAILPAAVITGPSGHDVRRALAARFHVDTIVSSHDPERIYMSENTKIGEVLIVCRRWTTEDPKPPTRFINLKVNPNTGSAAQALALRLAQEHNVDFTTQEVSADRIATGDWNAVNFYSPFLVQAFSDLVDGGVVKKVRKLSEIADVSPEGRSTRGAFSRSDQPTQSGRRALWYHKTDVTQSVRAATDSYIEPKKDKTKAGNNVWNQRSRLLLTHRLWLPLARVCAVLLDAPAIGSRWTPCRPKDGEHSTAQAIAAYLNSSVGVLALLGARDNRKPSYPQFSMDTLRALPVPDFLTLTDARDLLAQTVEGLLNDLLLPLPQMNDDPVRRQLDEAVTTALNLDPEWVAQIRQALSEEPSVTNRRFGT